MPVTIVLDSLCETKARPAV